MDHGLQGSRQAKGFGIEMDVILGRPQYTRVKLSQRTNQSKGTIVSTGNNEKKKSTDLINVGRGLLRVYPV